MVAPAFIVQLAKNNMKKIFALIFCCFALFSCADTQTIAAPKNAAVAAELSSNDFVKGSEDIPLIQGLELVESENVDFDSESGSFSSIEYKSPFYLEAVQNFYLRTLPQMGWKLIRNDQTESSFTREGERLKIEFLQKDHNSKSSFVRFYFSSAPRR